MFPIITITPINPSVKIRFSVASEKLECSLLVQLKVYDITGNEIIMLVNENKLSGNYDVEFKEEDLTNGIYFYQLNAGNFTETKKMVLMR